ncbi:MAG: thioredoxin domain-containing protein [Pseudomonadota bacterium]
MLKTLIAAAGLALMLPGAAAHADDQKRSQPKLYSVLFYADWCSSCKLLDPKIERARAKAELDQQPVLFVRFDLTDADTTAQSELLAESLGLSAYLERNGGRTGYAVLVNAATGEQVSRFTRQMSDEAIGMAIKVALAL